MLKLLAVALSSVCAISLTACSAESASTSLRADVVLLDISGSSKDSKGSFSEENRSPSSLSERKRQLEAKIGNAITSRTAVYFGFVRNGYGVTDIATLVAPSLILEIDTVLSEEILNEKLREESLQGISGAWRNAIEQEQRLPNSCSDDPVERLILEKSNAQISSENAKRIAGKLCAGARNAAYQFDQLSGAPTDIGSDIQAAVDRSLQKLASDERRLLNSEGKQVSLISTIILVSDLSQVTQGVAKGQEVFATADPNKACELARQESKNFVSAFTSGISLISDGFAGTKKEINTKDRDKYKKYWECWFNTRGIDDLDIGAKGIDLGAL